jgi:hypothetical protein
MAAVDHPARSKHLRLRRGDQCASCGAKLAAGDEALWYRGPRVVTCVGCILDSRTSHETDRYELTAGEAAPSAEVAGVEAGQAGASALREYERRRKQREDRARQRLGVLGVALARITDEPQSTDAWQKGGEGEAEAARRLEQQLATTSVKLLHDRRVPGHGAANIDHLAVGPGGVTVIDTKNYRGKVRVERVGGPFSARSEVLKIDGRDQTTLIDGVERQIQHVADALRAAGHDGIDVRGALCMIDVQGLPLIRSQSVRGVLVDGPKQAAALANRTGDLPPEKVELLWRHLAAYLPTV